MRFSSSFALGLALALSFAVTPTLSSGAWANGKARLLSAYTWRSQVEGFGGFSALALGADGLAFTVLSDRGRLGQGRLKRDAEGRITGAKLTSFTPLLGTEGEGLTRFRADSEGLAIRPDGRLYISFEGFHRVWTYAKPGGPAAWLPRHPDFENLAFNKSLEALARAPDGTLYTIPEGPGAGGTSFPVYRYRKGKWDKPFAIPKRGDFLVTEAAIGPDDRLYVLERSFGLMTGFASRVRRFEVSENALSHETVVLTSPAGERDNLEGMALWQAPDGLRMTLISDDNQKFFQRTEIVEYLLPR